jgi:hypothetical protein
MGKNRFMSKTMDFGWKLKRCPQCNKEKPEREFGGRTECKQCRSKEKP